ncbi:EAL domain-containing protein [Sporosarcina sp. NPDC096371]|uniref:EAL domain-containing protein n=1 Tax=Sporosarcina sp. NPDC096371 TaxID=3364530 RepID=UPI00381A0467
MHSMHGTHNFTLVALSLLFAFLTSLTAIETVRRTNFSVGWQRKLWLFGGSAAMGIGIWAMHFIAMLAFKLPVPVQYDILLVLVSIIVAISASLCGLYVSYKSNMNSLNLVFGGCFMGVGISGMHYIGMAAMKGIRITYDPFLVVVSLVLAISASIIALMLAFRFRGSRNGVSSNTKLVSATVMGIAISSMHYTGMFAATIVPDNSSVGKVVVALDTSSIVVGLTMGTIVILGIVLAISFVLDRRLEEEMTFKGAILESVLDCLIIIDHKGNIIECNPASVRTFGYIQEELIGHNLKNKLLVQPSAKQAEVPSITASDGKMICDQRLETIGVRCDGDEFPIELTITKIKREGLPLFTVYARDITKVKQSEDIIKKMAYRDFLTSLPNRRFFNEHLRMALKEAEAHQTKVAVLYLDLDGFKLINDSMGHTVGDLMLKSVAERLQNCMETQNTVARNGGDEFTIILNGTTRQEAENIVGKLIQSLAQPFDLEGHEAFITTSIGIAMYPSDGENQETLVKHADIAMYEAKEQGRNGYSFFRKGTDLQVLQKLQLVNELRMALERDEFVVYYQPRLHVDSGQIIGVEALVRWNHPEKGFISPDDFIPQAEESGLIVPIGNWVLRTAVAQCKKWQDNSLPLEMSVNLSAVQFQKPELVKMVSETLQDEGLAPELLNLEITENMMMDAEYSIQVLRELKKLGVQISIDDFGTGYNSLSYLKKMPIDHIKVDRSFLRNVTSDSENAAIVRAIISIARSLQLNVIAEGVEDEEQLAFLTELHCEEIQGYLLSPPIPAAKLEMLVANHINHGL